MITVSAPGIRSFYGAEVLVEGRIRNSPDSARASQIAEFAYRVVEEPQVTGQIYYNQRDGEFWFSFPTRNWSGTYTLEIVASNTDGHESVAALELHDGNLQPVVELAGPEIGRGYGARMLVRGRAYDPSDDLGQPRDIALVEYEVYPAGTFSAAERVSGSLSVQPDGSFSGVVATGSFSGDIDLIVRARTAGDKVGERIFTLSRADGDIPSFRAIAGDGRVELAWTELPGTVRYDLSYAADDDADGWTVLRDTRSSTVLPLVNGERYRFRLEAVVPGGRIERSAVRRNVPLAGNGRPLESENEYLRVRLTWNAVPGAESYRVMRSTIGVQPAQWLTVATVRAPGYVDNGVRIGESYVYRVGPNYPDGVLSASRTGGPAVVPAEPIRLASEIRGGPVVGVAVTGAYVIALDGSTLRVIDIEDHRSPVEVGSVSLSRPVDLAVRGQTVAVADSSGISIVDIGNKRAPQVVRTVAAPGVRGVCYVEATSGAIVAAAVPDGVLLFPAAVPAGPGAGGTGEAVSRLTATGITGIASSGRYLVVGHATATVVYDCSRAEAPREIGRLPEASPLSLAIDTGLDLVAVGATSGTELYRLSEIGRGAAPVGRVDRAALDVSFHAVAGRELFMGTDSAGVVHVADVSEPGAPRELAAYQVHSPTALAPTQTAGDDTIAVVGRQDGLGILDLFVVVRSHVTTSTVTGGIPGSVDLVTSRDRTYLAVADGPNGVALYRTDSSGAMLGSAPVLRVPASQPVRTVVEAGEPARLFVADGAAGLRAFALRTDAGGGTAGGTLDAEELLAFPTDGTLRDLALVERRIDGELRTIAYLANGDGGFVVADVTDPAVVRQMGSIVLRDARSVLVADGLPGLPGGNRLLVADAGTGVLVVDASDPALPVIERQIAVPGARQLAIYQPGLSPLVVALSDAGVYLLDPARNFGILGFHPTRFGERFALTGSLLVLAEGFRGVTTINLSDPSDPVVVGSSDLQYASGVAASGSTVYAVDNESLHVLNLQIPDWLRRAR